MDNIIRTKKVHVTQVFNIKADETNLDFFDTNLFYDSKLFIDPFLIKTSPLEKERNLYERFTIYFKTALNKSLNALNSETQSKKLLQFFNFHEPKEICLGYTEKSNQGLGLGNQFATGMYKFFLEGLGAKLVNKEDFYLNKLIDPKVFAVLADKVNQDGISDLAANLIMDYLIEFTQEQCKKWNIPITKILPVSEMFDYENLEWTGGRNVYLPENPFRPGEPFILVPKHFLRADEDVHQEAKKKIIGILATDENLSFKFSSLIEKPLKDISIEEIRAVMTEDDVMERFIEYLEQKEIKPYNFILDPLFFYAFKKYQYFFKDKLLPNPPSNCDDVVRLTKNFLLIFKNEFEHKDLWKDAWVKKPNGSIVPCLEEVWGRILRAMGTSFFSSYPEVTFLPEVESGNGPVDFSVIYKNCRLAIEIKKLENDSPTGTIPKLPAYLHGIVRQLPAYIINIHATHGFYITGQHYRETLKFRKRKLKNHDYRVKEIENVVSEIKSKIKSQLTDFEELVYINIDLTRKPSASKL